MKTAITGIGTQISIAAKCRRTRPGSAKNDENCREIVFGEKERSFGALQQHIKEHGCRSCDSRN